MKVQLEIFVKTTNSRKFYTKTFCFEDEDVTSESHKLVDFLALLYPWGK